MTTKTSVDFTVLNEYMDAEFAALYNVFTNSEWVTWSVEDQEQLRTLLSNQIAQWNNLFRGPFDSTVWKGNADGSISLKPIRAENTGAVGRKPKEKPVTPAEIRARFAK